VGASEYIDPSEYAAYGLPSGTTVAQVQEASQYINGYLRRPEGLVWKPDFAGNPAYMDALNPDYSLTLTGAISPGQNVVANVAGPLAQANVGDTVVLDKASQNTTETVVIVAKNGNALTFGNVQLAHANGGTADGGLSITERRYLPKNRPITVLTRTPMVMMLSGIGRYAYSRRGDAPAGNTDDFNLLAVYSEFGGPPAWEVFNPASTEFDPRTGQLWIPAGIMLAYYTEVQVRYLAGFSTANIPPQLKTACAKLIKALANDVDLGPAKSYRAGDTAIQKFADTMISGDVAMLLQEYRARVIA
jgi:hypothetical protein